MSLHANGTVLCVANDTLAIDDESDSLCMAREVEFCVLRLSRRDVPLTGS